MCVYASSHRRRAAVQQCIAFSGKLKTTPKLPDSEKTRRDEGVVPVDSEENPRDEGVVRDLNAQFGTDC